MAPGARVRRGGRHAGRLDRPELLGAPRVPRRVLAEWHGFNVSNNYFETYIATGEKLAPERLPGYQTDALTDLSIDVLRRRPTDAPWFHVLAYESPHPGAGGQPRSPGYPVPEAYEDLVDPATLELRDNVPAGHRDAARLQLAGYYRMIRNLDDNVGRMLAYFDDSGLAANTLVVFLSDHGEMGGSHGVRHKHVPFDESVHVPLVWRLPGVLPAGGEHAAPICGVDVYPTTAGLCGVPLAAPVAGIDHATALANASGVGAGTPTVAPPREDVLLQWEVPRFDFGDHPYRGVRTARHTYTVGRDAPFCLLFDRVDDPFEMRNLFGETASRELRSALHERLEALLLEHEGALPAYVVAARPSGG